MAFENISKGEFTQRKSFVEKIILLLSLHGMTHQYHMKVIKG
jgi:hypothetical protein